MLKTKLFNRNRFFLSMLSLILLTATQIFAQNPLITNQFTADPSARVFGDRVYVYPSHDILANKERGREGWFCMEDYHVFSSANLTDWEDHGVIVTQNKVPWVKPNSYSMWAPDCIERNGKYYFYFPSTPADTTDGRGFRIGVAIADRPTGPFVPQDLPIAGVRGIDPNVFIDKDGQAYLYWSQGNIYGAKLKENMTELASEPVIFKNLPAKGLKEGPYLFERKGVYYLTYPHVENKTERLEYAMSNSPLGPFKVAGVIMDETAGCWTNHHSVIKFKNQWLLFYHTNDLSPNFDKARSIRADSLFFNTDGTIVKVKPTLRGIGLTKATGKIQIDRYSASSGNGTEVLFVDSLKKFDGWKVLLKGSNAWVSYNSVDFGKQKLKTIQLKVRAENATQLVIKSIREKQTLAKINIPKNNDWSIIEVPATILKAGIKDLLVENMQNIPVEIDWISFK